MILPDSGSFSDLLTGALADKGLNAHTAQGLLCCSDSAIYDWLAGTSLPPGTKVPLLAERLGIPEDRLRAVITRERRERAARAAESLHRDRPAHAGDDAARGAR